MRNCSWLALLAIGSLFVAAPQADAAETAATPAKPLFRDFMGLCTHTIQFRPDLYKPVCRLLRDYHGFDWDMGADTDYTPKFPFARNRVNWDTVYGSWKSGGFETDVSIMFGNTPPDKWKDMAKDARAYGEAFAKFFGPSSEKKLVSSVEIGNEPGHYDDAAYRKLFESMARGLREGDPKLIIVTCAATPGKSHKYAKSLSCVVGFEALYDAINIHVYAQVEGWPTWRRSFPEDPGIEYLKEVERTIAWRDAHAKDKPIWISEFGWDSCTRPAPREGTFAKWVGVNDTQQARYLVRSFLVFSKMPVARAYIFFFNDKDEPQVHGSAGLTRDFKPKPSFHAVAHLYKTLGAYRFTRTVVERPGDLYAYEFAHDTAAGDRVLAVWSPTGSERKCEAEFPLDGSTFVRAERMPLAEGEVPAASVKQDAGKITVECDESPLYIWLKGAQAKQE